MRKRVLFAVITTLAVLSILAVSGVALAQGSYLSSFTGQYPAAKGSNLDSCNTCHRSDFSLNAYGTDFGAA
ncbi:MAG TPA: hypothetical protein VGL40_05350, partial [Bacillota bacterium]